MAYSSAKTREWKDGNTAATGTRAFGSYFDDEFDQLYANWNEFFTSDGLEFSIPTADIDTVKTDEIIGTDGGDVNLASIKHLIREFTVATGESVTAGQVVEYINGEIRGGIGGNLEAGSQYDFNTSTNYISSSLISENKFVIVYTNLDALNEDGTAIVGVIDGNSITFGSPVAYDANPNTYKYCCTLSEDKFFIAYSRGTDGYGTGIVGTVSDTTITFGSPVVFESADSEYISCCTMETDKVFIAYRDVGNSSYGTAIICTISGTVPTFGTAVVFESADSEYISCCTMETDKVFITYRDVGNSSYGTAIICTISGTVPTFGTAVVFESATVSYTSICSFDRNKICIAYYNATSFTGKAIVGSISGTVPTFGTAVVFHSATINYPSICSFDRNKICISFFGLTSGSLLLLANIEDLVISFYDSIVFGGGGIAYFNSCIRSEENKICISFSNQSTTKGQSVIVNIPELLGISQEAASAGETAKIVMEGVSTAHTGLIEGMSYYADSDGDFLDPLLKLPGTYIGQALSDTELRIKF